MYEKKLQLSSIINNIYSRITQDYQACQYTSSKYHALAMFVFFNYSLFLSCLNIQFGFGSFKIITNPFFEIRNKLFDLLNIYHIFSKKELKNTTKLNQITKQNINTFIITTILNIIIGLLFITIVFFKNLGDTKQYLDVINTIDRFFKKIINTSIVPLLCLNDNEIIFNVGFGCESESIGQGRSYSQKNINISNCFFSRSSSYSGSGGVIYVSGGSYSMNINNSMFYNCVCSNIGGAIYFSSHNSSLSMICANRCSCDVYSSCHFAYLIASQVNQVEFISVSNCSHVTSGISPFALYTGNQRVDNTNSSMNNAIQISGIWISSPSSFISSHCTFSNNKVTGYSCIYFSSTSGIMSNANIVHNNSPSNYGIVHVDGAGSRKMIYCIFQNNQNRLFYVLGGSLEVSHSFIYHSTASFSISTSVSTSNNNSMISIITYQLPFFNSYYCSTDSPDRTPDESPTPNRTLDETPMSTLERTLINTPNETPYSTPEESPIRSLQETIRGTNELTMRITYERTIDQTIRETIINTQNESPMKTLEHSPIKTIDQTIRETLGKTVEQTIRESQKETIPRTYVEIICTNQMGKKREISVIFSLTFLYSAIILMI